MSARPSRHRTGPLARIGSPFTNTEHALLADFDSARRLSLLRLILPGLLIITLLALPFALQADFTAATWSSTLQDSIGLVAFAIGFVAVRRRNANLAALMLFIGVSGVIILLTLQDGPLQGQIDLTAVPAFALFTLPIVIASIFGTGRTVALATAAAVSYTLALLLLTPHTPALAAALAGQGGLAAFTVPIACQLAIGTLMFGATRAVQHTQRELYDVRAAYERERELDRMKDQFIASVNHELRTPIMALQGYIEIAREQASGAAPEQHYTLERAAGAVEHLAGIARSVLDVRLIEAASEPHLAAFALRPVALAAAQLLDPRDAGGVARDLTVRVSADLFVYADEQRVRQVLVNLLSNAAKYSPPGTPIEVSARAATGGKSSGSHAKRQEVEIAVRDWGPGIPPEKADMVFERFTRLERDIASPTPGAGLGLALSRTYVSAMGGRIWIESNGIAGEGTTMCFTLPSAPPTAEAARQPDRV
jgi:signal transduction histidine kinase